MNRNLDFNRLFLLKTGGEDPKPDLLPCASVRGVCHSDLLVEAGFIDGAIVPNASDFVASAVRLRPTWARHKLFYAACNYTICHKASDRIKKSGLDVMISLLKEILTQLLNQSLSLP